MALDLRAQLQAALGSTYTIEHELSGGMSRVFVAKETRLGRNVVIKVLNPELAAAVSAERFEQEMRIAAQLQDPRIVPVLSAGEAGGLAFYTMPFVEGESLRARLTRVRLPLAQCIAILRDVALALEYAHARGIVHRDIKPENILLSNNTAVVTDFGIAKAIAISAEGSPLSMLTRQGLVLGTPAYMAPEQALGEAGVDQRADIYAWGVVAYEILTGAHPFGSKVSPQAMVAAHLAETPVSLDTRVRGLPSGLANLVERAMCKDPAGRPADASELVRVLDRGGAIAASGTPAVRRRRTQVRTIGVLIGVIVAIAAVLALGRTRRHANPDAGATAVRSIAVMPFAEMGGDSATAYLGDGMADALTTTLAKLPNLRLVAPRPVAAAPEKRLDPLAAGRALKVDAVLEGTVQRLDGQLRIRAHPTRVSDGTVLWGERYDRRASNMFELEDDVTASIAFGLRGTLSGERANFAAGAPRGTMDLEAYDPYLRGRYAWSKRGERGIGTAINLFKTAIARDPGFARAYAGLAMAYVVLPIFTASVQPDSAMALALRSASRALALDSSLADAHLATAYALKMLWRWGEAERHFRAAAALAPEEPEVHHWYGVYLFAIGDMERSLAEFRRARELDPFANTIATDGAIAFYLARRLSEARDEIKRAFVFDTTRSDTWYVQGLIQLAQGHADSAVTSCTTARQLGATFDLRPFLIVAFRALGRTREADSAYSELRRDYTAGRALPYDMAVAALSAGERATAMAAVLRIVERRDTPAPSGTFAVLSSFTAVSLPCDPLLDPLKSDPRFEQLLSGAGMTVCRRR